MSIEEMEYAASLGFSGLYTISYETSHNNLTDPLSDSMRISSAEESLYHANPRLVPEAGQLHSDALQASNTGRTLKQEMEKSILKTQLGGLSLDISRETVDLLNSKEEHIGRMGYNLALLSDEISPTKDTLKDTFYVCLKDDTLNYKVINPEKKTVWGSIKKEELQNRLTDSEWSELNSLPFDPNKLSPFLFKILAITTQKRHTKISKSILEQVIARTALAFTLDEKIAPKLTEIYKSKKTSVNKISRLADDFVVKLKDYLIKGEKEKWGRYFRLGVIREDGYINQFLATTVTLFFTRPKVYKPYVVNEEMQRFNGLVDSAIEEVAMKLK